MKTYALLENLTFHEANPNAEPLSVEANGRVLRFTLKPGQSIREHHVPSAPFFVVVLQGAGIFTGGNGKEERVGPNALLTFAPGEKHSVRALETELVFVGFLQGVPAEAPSEGA